MQVFSGPFRTVAVTLAAAVALLLAGCDPDGDVPGHDPGPSVTSRPKAETGCGSAAGKAGALLPAGTSTFSAVDDNPCIPLADLAGAVLDLVPSDAGEATKAHRAQFRSTVAKVSDPLLKAAGRALSANAVAQCGYETDHLAVRLYQQDGYAWSVGAAAVIRGDIDAAADIGVCYLKGLLPQFAPPSPGVTVPPPEWSPCASTSRPIRRGEVYTVIIAGTSDQMCQFLAPAV
ncbi:hypothetical protein ACQEVB_11350 [Pseudonocardia sp. CA-107938]|uniref:hypothetical protein n=1 Tax=Pseudonocardia sp. CA-107938 TaxID=3240021 RepID=UPI003D8EB7BA